MKQITLSFTAEEYRELAKLVSLGSNTICSADDYPGTELVKGLLLKICIHGYVQVPECGAFQVGGGGMGKFKEPEFLLSDELSNECDELEETLRKSNSWTFFPVQWQTVIFMKNMEKWKRMTL